MSTVATEQRIVYLPTPLGTLQIQLSGECVTSLDITTAMSPRHFNPTAAAVCAELQAYFADPQHRFALSLHLYGTPFQRRVWRALQRIPVGQTRTYGDLAKALQSSPRAVGNACRANPVPIIVPCHRIVAANGLGGYSGQTRGRQMQIKRWLLSHEGVLSQ